MDDQVTTNQNDAFTSSEHTSTGKGTIVIDDQKYAIGLLWQPLQNPEDHLPEIRETLESEEGADLYCLRNVKTAQYGIGKTSMGHRNGMPSLAATVASSLEDYTSYCCVFQVDEGWWFLAVRNDLILSEEDVLYTTEEEAMRAFTSMMAVPDWDLKVVPATWQMEGTEQRSLLELVQGGHKFRLEEINAVHRTKYLLVLTSLLLALIGVAIWGIFNLWHQIMKPQQIPQVETPVSFQQIAPTPEKAKPWEEIVPAEILMKRCWDNAYQLKTLIIPGWNIGIISCTPEGVATSWSRDAKEGSLVWMRFALDDYQLNNLSINIDDSGTSAVGTVVFENMPKEASQPTWTTTQLQEDLAEIIRSLSPHVQLQYNQQQLVDPPNRPDGSRPANQRIYNFFSFSVTSEYSPWEWKKFFDKFTGLQLLKIEYNPSNDATTKWKYEGRIYAK